MDISQDVGEVLQASLSSANTGPVADSLASAAASLRQCKLRLAGLQEEVWTPALEFLAIMGWGPAKVFRGVFAVFCGALADRLDCAQRLVLEQILPEMLGHRKSPGVLYLLAVALERLGGLPQPAGATSCSVEEDVFRALAGLPDVESEKLPHSLHQRLLARDLPRFHGKLQPIVARALEWLRYKIGPSMVLEGSLALMNGNTSELRSGFVAIGDLADLIGCSYELFEATCSFLRAKSDAAIASDEPIFKRSPLKDESHGAPVSIGHEPLLNTIRSQLLLALVDRNILMPSISGTWDIESIVNRKTIRYQLHITQHGDTFSGTSTLNAKKAYHVSGGIRCAKQSDAPSGCQYLTFEQVGGRRYSCRCYVTQDLQELLSGKWLDVDTKSQGNFIGRRIGPTCYADRHGRVWDHSLHYVILCDSVHREAAALGDSFQHMIMKAARFSVGFEAGSHTDGMPQVTPCVASILSDTNVVQSLLRGLMYSRRNQDDPLERAMDDRERMILLLLLWAAAVEPSNAPFCKPLLEQLGEGPPSEDSLKSAGLRCDLLAKSLHYFSAGTLSETENGPLPAQQQTDFTLHLEAALRSAGSELPRCIAASNVMRLMCNFMANFAILERRASLLRQVLAVIRDVVDTKRANRPDWITRQLVDTLVNSGIYLGRSFDADLRNAVLEYVMPLAKVDAWIHFRVAEMLKTAFTTGISMAREQLRVLSELLPEGLRKDSHYDWTMRLATAYAAIFKVRIHLQNHFESSDLGKLATEYAGAVTDVGDDQAIASKTGGVAADAPVQPSSGASEANFGAETVANSVASRSTVAASGEEEFYADGTPASNLSSPGNARRKVRLRQWAQAILETQDGALSPSIDTAVRVYCADSVGEERELASKAVELLQSNFIGSHSLCADAARWYVRLQRDGNESHACVDGEDGHEKRSQGMEHFDDEHQLLMRSLLETMEEAFDMKKADSVWEKRDEEGTIGTLESLKDFCGAFIRVAEFRQLIYKLCAPMQAQASNFLSYMLFRITKSTSVRDGLQEVMSKNVFAINRNVFDFALQDKIRSFFQVAVEAGHPIGPSRISDYALGSALAELCKVCNFSEATYLYSQALLFGLAAARKSSKHVFRYISEAVSRTMPSRKSKPGLWLLDMRFRGLGRHRELFEILAAMYSTRQNITGDDSSGTFSRPRLALTTCAHPAQRLHCDISPRAVKSICSLLEDLLCPEAKELWQRVGLEANSTLQNTLCDRTGFWQSSAFFRPLAMTAMVNWTFPYVDAKERERIVQEYGWVMEPPEVEENTQPGDWTYLSEGPGIPEDEDSHRKKEFADDDDSDGAHTEAALDDDWGELDEGFEEAVLAAEISTNKAEWDAGRSDDAATVLAADVSTDRAEWDLEDDEESRSHASSIRMRSSRTLCAQRSEPSSFTESGYKMHAVSSRSMGSVSTNELPGRAGQDFEEIGAQSVLEFFRNPTFLEALVKAFLKVGHKKATRGSFVKLLALITTDGLLEEESCKKEALRGVFLAQMAVRELLAIKRLCHLESKHRKGIASSWSFRLHFVMHFQSTAIASFAGLVWIREHFLDDALPYCELLERMYFSNLPFVFLESALQSHPQQGEEVLVVLVHMLQILSKRLQPEDWIEDPEFASSEMDDQSLKASWEKATAALEEVRENVRSRIASMLVYLIAAHQLELPVFDFLEEALPALRPRALKLFVVEMLGAIHLPASERVMWAVARCVARPEVSSLLEGDASADICAAVGRFCMAYDESPLRGQKLSEESALSKLRCETDERVKELRAKLRDALNSKSNSALTPTPVAPPEAQSAPPKAQAVAPAAEKENRLWSWFMTTRKTSSRAVKKEYIGGNAAMKRKARSSGKRPKNAARRKDSTSSEKVSEDDDDEDDESDDEEDYDLDADLHGDPCCSSVGSVSRKSTKTTGGRRNRFVSQFDGKWTVQWQHNDKMIGYALVDKASSSCVFHALQSQRQRPMDIRGKGTKADPFVVDRGGKQEARLETITSNKLTWKFATGNRTVWTRDSCMQDPTSPPTPPTPRHSPGPCASQCRRSNTPERSDIGVESVASTLDDVTIVSAIDMQSQRSCNPEGRVEDSPYAESMGGLPSETSLPREAPRSEELPRRKRLKCT